MRFNRELFDGVTVEETIAGSGYDWAMPAIVSRIEWLDKSVGNENYILWYASHRSDNMFIKFKNGEDAALYRLIWMIEDASNQ